MTGLVLVRLAFIQIGYRGYDRAGTAPRFAFGHGLGYVEPVSAEAGRPVRTLAAFAAAAAEPGQAAEVRLTVPAPAFAGYDEAAGCWVRSAGEFIVRVGRSSADLRLSVVVRSLFVRTDHPARRRKRLVNLVVSSSAVYR